MAQTQAFGIAACTFGSTQINGCTRITIREHSTPMRAIGDGDHWPAIVAAENGAVEWTLEFSSIAAAQAAQTRMFGTPATLTAAAHDAAGGTFGLTVNIAGAFVLDRRTSLGDKRDTACTVSGEALSPDAITSPVSYG